jgi:transaldolase
MQFFVDTANIEDIKELNDTGLVDGVTTNPSLVAKENKDFKEILKEICNIVDGPVSAEVAATSHLEMMKEAEILTKISEKITIKLPLTWDGLKTCKQLSKNGIDVNVTLCFSANQALLAAKCGATYISPFVGRLDDLGQDGIELIADIRAIYDNYPDLDTQILVASIRHPIHLLQSAKIGADVATLPPKVIKQLANHPLTDKGLDTFLKDWQKSGQKITA